MSRFALFFAAAMVAAPAVSATYSAKPVAPAEGKIIDRNISWACAGQSCTGNTDNSRPLVLCQGLAKKAGTIASFAVNGRELDANELAKCNKSANGGASTALATAN